MSKNQKTGGNTQAIDSPKPKKPKPIAMMTLTVREDTTIAGDFWVWETDELDRNKKWTVSAEDFFKFIHSVQPNNVKVLASCCNVQIVTAGLPEECQGPWVSAKSGKTRLLTGEEVKNLMAGAKNSFSSQSEKLVDSATKAAEKAIGFTAPTTPSASGPTPI